MILFYLWIHFLRLRPSLWGTRRLSFQVLDHKVPTRLGKCSSSCQCTWALHTQVKSDSYCSLILPSPSLIPLWYVFSRWQEIIFDCGSRVFFAKMVKNLKVEGQGRETRQDDAKLLAPLLDKTEVWWNAVSMQCRFIASVKHFSSSSPHPIFSISISPSNYLSPRGYSQQLGWAKAFMSTRFSGSGHHWSLKFNCACHPPAFSFLLPCNTSDPHGWKFWTRPYFPGNRKSRNFGVTLSYDHQRGIANFEDALV